MSADLLRRAAVKLREAAEKASKGPWDAADDGLVWPDRLGDPVSGSTESEDAEYIALMHPPVALGLADLIEEGLDYASMAHPERYPVYIKAVAAARAVLREEAS